MSGRGNPMADMTTKSRISLVLNTVHTAQHSVKVVNLKKSQVEFYQSELG